MNAEDAASRAAALFDELRAALPKELLLMLVDYVASCELSVEALQKQDAGKLRHAVAALALEALGCTPQLIDTIKQRLAGSAERPQSLRRH